MERLSVDLCIIGAGAAGLSLAAGASQLGQKVVLIERGQMGGDCLNVGCVPSKALLAAGRAAKAGQEAARFGITFAPPQIDWLAVRAHLRGVIAAIAPNDSEARYRGLGVEVIKASARFVSPQEVEADGRLITARRFVIATGSRPLVPPVPGLADAPYLTNETLFDLEMLPRRLLIMGAGPIGCELGQAFRHLGSEVVMVEMGRLLPKDDTEAAEVLRRHLLAEGVELHEGTKVVAVESNAEGPVLVCEKDGAKLRLEGSHLLLAAGRRHDFSDLSLDKAGVALDARGRLVLDAQLRSANKRIYAAGDAAGGLQFTHVAGFHAAYLIKRLLFRLPGRAQTVVPWVTYTEPEVAQVGLSEAEAAATGPIRVLRWPFGENDRALAERDTEGFVKILTDAKGRLLGATIVGRGAGDLIQPVILAISERRKVLSLAKLLAPYPTRGEAVKRAASGFFLDKLFSARTKRLVRWLARLG